MNRSQKLAPYVERLRAMVEAIESRDAGALEVRIADAAAGTYSPGAFLAIADDPAGKELARAWFEALDDAIGLWLDCEGAAAARKLLGVQEDGFELGSLLFLPMFLRITGAPRIDQDMPTAPLANEKFEVTALVKALLRCDATTELDYEKTIRGLDAWIRPAFVTWFLGCYLASPLEATDPRVVENRARAVDGFVAFHDSGPAKVPFSFALGSSAFAAPGFAPDATRFLSTLSRAILEPAFAAPSRVKTKTEGEGIVLTAWNPEGAVHRCLARVVPRLEVATRFVLDPESDWDGDCYGVSSSRELHAVAHMIDAARLDFLFYPEVGLTTTSRWLATRRLARVQAVGYGHPVTTGSTAMDYFVGGAAVETDGTTYRERLVLLPGIGMTSTEPPAPTYARSRPADAKEPIFVSFASYDKLTPEVFAAWERILTSIPGARLELVPGLPENRVVAVAGALSAFFVNGDVALTPHLPRQACVDLVAESDVYLDTWPFGGYSTLVEALASGCPVVTLEGRHAYGRYGAALLRELELPEWLIASNVDDYIAAAIRLGSDPVLRAELRMRLARPRVLARLCNDDIAAHFDAAVEWMRKEGPTRGRPVLIEAGSAPRFL